MSCANCSAASLAARTKAGFEIKCFRRIAGQEQLGEQDEIGTLRGGFGARLPGERHVAANIAYDRVELRERELELVLDRMSHGRNLERKRPN